MIPGNSLPINRGTDSPKRRREEGGVGPYELWEKELRSIFIMQIPTKDSPPIGEKHAIIEAFFEKYIKHQLRSHIGPHADYGYHARKIKSRLMRCFRVEQKKALRLEGETRRRIMIALAEEHREKYADFYEVGTRID